jgi:hypothetical protein
VWADLKLDTPRAADGRDTAGGGIVVVVVADATAMNIQGSADRGPAARRWPERAGE